MKQNAKFIMNLLKSNRNYSKIMSELEKDFKDFKFNKSIKFERTKGKEQYKKNFFSIFMVSLFRFLLEDEKKINDYGKATFYLRGIITCTDNIIDQEEKGIIFLEGIKEDTTKNILLILTLQYKLNYLVNEISENPSEISRKIIESINLIAQSEGKRDLNIYSEYPTFEFIEKEIHSGIGGELLKIGILLPLLIEQSDKFKVASESFYNLGMSLQSLDDLCDMEEDFLAKKINLGISFFREELKLEPEKIIKINLQEEVLTKKYLMISMNYAIKSFELLESIGYPINKKLGLKMLKHLFEARGLKKLWNIIEKEI